MDPDNYIKMAIIIGSVTGIIILVSLCIVYRTQIFRLLCGDQTAIVVPVHVPVADLEQQH